MNADLTIDTLAFKTQYNDASGSLRTEISRGVNLPEKLFIRNRDTVQSSSKKPAHETSVKFERHLAMTDGSIAPVEITCTVRYPIDTAVTNADVLAVVQRTTSLLSDEATSGLDLKEEVFVNREQ